VVRGGFLVQSRLQRLQASHLEHVREACSCVLGETPMRLMSSTAVSSSTELLGRGAGMCRTDNKAHRRSAAVVATEEGVRQLLAACELFVVRKSAR
jgi:hypothetical protein